MNDMSRYGYIFIRVPRGGVAPIRASESLNNLGHCTTSLSCCLISSLPPISSQRTYKTIKINTKLYKRLYLTPYR